MRKQFKHLRHGDVFTFDNSDKEYVKIGNHGARAVYGYRVDPDDHAIPALYEQVNKIRNLAD